VPGGAAKRSSEPAAAKRSSEPAAEGELRIGPYRVQREIGAGGMSVVYRSVQENLARPVAIKVLRAEIAAQGPLSERFDREALSLAALQHENILHIYDYRTEGQLPYMVTEYVEGVDLYDVLERHGRLPLDVAAIVGFQVARALDYAHSRGVIHRDVKPANIMFTVSGVIKLMDFGIARRESFGDLTQAGAGVGTPAYMSPEQILGERLDGRTDIWSLGVVLYQMLTGQKPFRQDDDRTVLHNIRVQRPSPPRQLVPPISREIERIVMRCLEKSARDRYPVAQQLAMALERFAATRLTVPPKVRLVSWMESLGELTPEQAQAALPADASEGLRAQWRQEVTPPREPWLGIPAAVWVAGVSAVLFVTLLVVVLGNWPSQREREAPAPPPPVVVSTPSGPVGPGVPPAASQGALRVQAHPWAHVEIDGQRRETTPFARPIRLAPGSYEVVLVHPALGRRERTVTVTAGEVASVDVDLTESPPRPARSRPSRPGPMTRRARRAAPRPARPRPDRPAPRGGRP